MNILRAYYAVLPFSFLLEFALVGLLMRLSIARARARRERGE